jgi:ParB/RepB/Spo0J family partition protein
MIRREHRELPLSLVDEPDAPSRMAFPPEAIDELASSMRAMGQLQPGGVVPRGDRFVIVYGHRRLLAARKAELETYAAYIYASDTEAMLGAQLDENVIREDLHPVEEAHWFAQLLDALGEGTDALATRLHKSRDYVEGRLNLLKGDTRVLDALSDNRIGIGVAMLLNTIEAESARRYFLDCAARLHAPRRTVEQWIAEWRASGAVAIADAPASLRGDAGAEITTEPLLPTCAFCGGTEDPWLFEFEWIHKHCRKARNNIVNATLEEGPVRNG